MKKNIAVIFILLSFISCADDNTDCEGYFAPYWTTEMLGKPHNTKLKGENYAIRKAFSELKKLETEIQPKNGFITIKLHLDKYGGFCKQEIFELNSEYQNVNFNNGDLVKKLGSVSSNLKSWSNDTETQTYYLINFTIKNGKIEEIF
ncbi:hypothetical protein [Cochleicola gelatinilyticus]|uniref:Lipoprotein n=1 Tax=Cochleicola gelatinilyticus TaxID=1763537 RepID=A0A167JRQ8_9FLAO|nr:hypothetical protein [Cochleicola gelatinilyticus]OAB80926.1 hypothetical protein ULVI_01915 [Cochleicola gelatinilyticus]